MKLRKVRVQTSTVWEKSWKPAMKSHGLTHSLCPSDQGFPSRWNFSCGNTNWYCFYPDTYLCNHLSFLCKRISPEYLLEIIINDKTIPSLQINSHQNMRNACTTANSNSTDTAWVPKFEILLSVSMTAFLKHHTLLHSFCCRLHYGPFFFPSMSLFFVLPALSCFTKKIVENKPGSMITSCL